MVGAPVTWSAGPAQIRVAFDVVKTLSLHAQEVPFM